MSDINTVTLTGNLGKEPQIYNNEQGTIARFSIASTEHYKSGEEFKERVQWNNVAVYDKFKAEYVEKNLHKGSSVLLQGALETRSWEDDSGKHYTTEVAIRPGKAFLRCLDVKPKEQGTKPAPDAKAAVGKRPVQAATAQPK